jgi:hypothetical protein
MTTKPHGFLGDTLYHFLGRGDDDALFKIFESIVAGGLLLTVGNRAGELDRFTIGMKGGKTETFEVMQNARVCFTDIPEDKLIAHSEEYGRFGIGFSRKVVLSWGGNPVVYVANDPEPDTAEGSMGIVLYLMHRIPLIAAALNACLRPQDAALSINETTLRGVDRDNYIDQAAFAVRRMWGFVKEMSHPGSRDYNYLYEREWRIVDGAIIDGKEITRELTDDEMRALRSQNPRWGERLNIQDTGIANQYKHDQMLQFFRIFNGIGDQGISKAIDNILVPNRAVQRRVQKFISENPEAFSRPLPRVTIFTSGRWWWRLWSKLSLK